MDIFDALLSGSKQSGVSPELLETLGKQAASRYIDEGVPLNESITKLASEHPGLENEHIKRVVEFANNETFQHLFKHSDDKNVNFDVADPGVVIRDLKDGGSPAHDGKTLSPNKPKQSGIPATDASFGGTSDYREDPNNVSPSNGFADNDSALVELFRQDQHSGAAGTGEAISKTASVHTEGGHANPIEDVYDEHVKLQRAESQMAEAHEQFDLLAKQASEDLYLAAKREILSYDGADINDVVHAVKLACPSDRVAFSILKPMAERLVKEGALRDDGNFMKTAHARILNPEHPLVLAVTGLVKAAQERDTAATALEEVRGGLRQTDAFLRSRVG